MNPHTLRAIHVSVWLFGVIQVVFDLLFMLLLLMPAPAAHADPSYCYTTGQFIPFPGYSGWCPDSEAPFHGPGPSYGGGNHRWPDGSDD